MFFSNKLFMNKSLDDYLGCEALLRKFFDTVGACSSCRIRGYTHCCDGKWYLIDSNKLLDIERERSYGEPKTDDMCGYHTEKGCLLKTHKSPVCISYVCDFFKKFLFSKDVDYNGLRIRRFLKKVLSGKAEEREIFEFKEKISDYISKVRGCI